MNISFSISDSEADVLAKLFGYDPKQNNRDEFVIEQFKEFGRKSIISHAFQVAFFAEENKKNAAVEAAKISISF